ncbi:hypothetical protein L1N85_17085 [Paenibacillus alkaliterrae]|uniref:hypothetical protein n=1 Tax=Paenibacillus alkaliterrae TaxID=320909 RepID=UPI001F328BE5|nr:hypothetical protein [Paenibacillus alkaliterrae]MCF2940122.1 hypothetical protein [Paenibacillus alkaliterrae]
MAAFILEDEMENVVSPQTKEYLKEVVSSYNHGNYRSAIVVLYTVVIFDLIEKMKTLSEIYNDEKAREILDEIERKQKEEKKSSDWERILVELVNKNTQLIDDMEKEKIDYLKLCRNYSAHPIYNNEYKLSNPTKEETRSLIRNCFEIVFKKEPLLSKKILDDLINDSKNYQQKLGIDGLESYLKARYFSKINDRVKKAIFDSLWRFVFKLENDNCNFDRKYNYYTLFYLVRNDEKLYYEVVKDNPARYSQIEIKETRGYIEYITEFENSNTSLIFFLAQYNNFFNYFTEDGKQIIRGLATKNYRFITIACYAFESIDVQLNSLRKVHELFYTSSLRKNWVEVNRYDSLIHDDLLLLYHQSKERGDEATVKRYIIEYFGGNMTFNGATSIWRLIEEIISEFNESEYNLLLNNMNSCYDIHHNHNLDIMIKKINETFEGKFHKVLDYSNYDRLSEKMKQA